MTALWKCVKQVVHFGTIVVLDMQVKYWSFRHDFRFHSRKSVHLFLIVLLPDILDRVVDMLATIFKAFYHIFYIIFLNE